MRHGIPVVLISLLLAGVAPADEEPAEAPMRVFRSVLDERPRIVTIRLHDGMYLAYDATDCSLYKAWSGKVNFDGAVYTTVHGPQPTSHGPAYFVDADGSQAFDVEGDEVIERRFRGYRIDDRNVTLNYTLHTKKGTAIQIQETPKSEPSEDEHQTLIREFAVRSKPAGAVVLLGKYKLRDGRLFRSTWSYSKASAIERWQQERAAAKKAAAEAEKNQPDKPKVEAHPENTPLGNGVSVRVYQVGKGMAQLHKLVPGQTPNWSHVIPVLDLRTERKDFGGGTDNFITHVDGFIEVETEGEYEFQLISDDGSRLYLNDKVVVDHDGLHGATAMEGKVRLTKGRHKLFVEHFENGGDEQLTLNWKTPGATEFVLVPNFALRAPTGEVRVTSPGNKKIIGAGKRRATPGDGSPLEDVHPAFDLMTVRPDDFKPRVGGMDWLPDRRLIICCWEPRGGVYVLDGVHGDDPSKITVKRIAEGLAEPLGLRVVDGRIFVLQKQELTELIDHDEDEVIDEYRCVAAGWGVTANFHEFAFGLAYKDEHFYAALATAINPGGASTQPQNPDRGKVVKIAMDGSYELIAHGLRTPNGVGIGIDGEIFVTDNQGDWLPVSKLVHVKPGAFYGGRSVDFEGTKDLVEQPPVVWLPQGEIGNSPGEPGTFDVGRFSRQMLHCDVTHGGLKRVFVEKIGGEYQGCVFRFTQGLEAGINRFLWGPDATIFVGGIGSAGNWGQTGKLKHGLQRLKYRNPTIEPFEMLAVRARKDGLSIEFTYPPADVCARVPDDYLIQQWRYVPTKAYGGPKVGVETLPVESVYRDNGGRTFDLRIPGLKAGHVAYVRLARTIRDREARAPVSTEAWYTLNRLGEEPVDVPRPTDEPPPAPNTLTQAEKDAGWELLFDGSSCEHWRGYKKKALPGAWSASFGALTFDPRAKDRGDIITKAQYESFELKLEWMIQENGNSGIMFHVSEEAGAPWATGPEMQILDNAGHPDGGATKTSAGSNYALHAPIFDVTRQPGRWNRVLLRVNGNQVTHVLNDWKLLEYEKGSDEWKKLVATSKFGSMPLYGTKTTGHIALQDHGDPVAFRNIKIRRIKKAK